MSDEKKPFDAEAVRRRCERFARFAINPDCLRWDGRLARLIECPGEQLDIFLVGLNPGRDADELMAVLTIDFPAALDCIAELKRELARRRGNTLLGLRGIGEPEDHAEPEFTLGVLAGGLKAEVERMRELLHEVWTAADKGDLDGVDLDWMMKCDALFAKGDGDASDS